MKTLCLVELPLDNVHCASLLVRFITNQYGLSEYRTAKVFKKMMLLKSDSVMRKVVEMPAIYLK